MTPERGLRELLATERGPMILAIQPVVGTSGVRPVVGALALGRWLDADRIDALREHSQVDLRVHDVANESSLPHGARALLDPSEEEVELRRVEIEADQIVTHSLLRDLTGTPAVALEIRTPRWMSRAGRRTVNVALGFLVLAGMLTVAATWWLLRRNVVRPLGVLTNAASEVGRRKDYSVRVESHTDDEIGQLAGALNEMLGQIEHRAHVVTEARHKAEEARRAAQQASSAQSTFLATMSHEMRTPMNGVIGMLELLRQSPLSNEQLDLTRTALDSGGKLLRIISDILDFSKIEAGNLILETSPFNLRQIVEDTVTRFAEAAQSRGLQLTWHVSEEVPRRCVGDSTRVKQILASLLANAMKFCPSGEVVVAVSTQHPADTVRFEVRDTGCGIDNASTAEIFEPFVQADSSTTREHGGTGLGLAICKELVDAMGGEIGLRSEPDVGSTFWFAIPLPPSSVPELGLERPEQLRGMRVLIVDDNATSRRVLEQQAASWQMIAGSAGDGDTALQILQGASGSEFPYDVVIIDMDMPAMSGLALARRIEAQPELACLPRVLLTSMSAHVRGDQLEQLGSLGCLTKPVHYDRLHELLCKVVAAEGSSGATNAQEERSSLPNEGRLGLRVLLVEDNVVNRKFAERALKSFECHVDTADNGSQALDLLARSSYDAVLMDCQMPVMDGYEATRAIREKEAEQHDTRLRVIGVTGWATPENREKCLAAGMDVYLAKPFTIRELRDALEPVPLA